MKFSVAMCTYNGASYLEEQLASITAQTRPASELVICDDGSTDATCEIIDRFAASSPFPVRFHANPLKLGSTKNFEQAIAFCQGDYVALCDQDDVWLPNRLEVIETEFDRAPNVGLVFSDGEVIDETGRAVGYTLWEKLPLLPAERRRLQGRKAIDDLLAGSTVTGATMVFRARFKDLILPIPDDLPIIHDAWIALLLAAVSEVVPLASPLIKYRQHGEQQVGSKARQGAPRNIRVAMRRSNSYQDIIEIGTRAQQRLAEHGDVYNSADAFSRLESRLDHLRTRGRLPEEALPRVVSVMKELMSGRYHSYSRGLLSAAKDLLRANAELSNSNKDI